jgi:lambda family phage portal protein
MEPVPQLYDHAGRPLPPVQASYGQHYRGARVNRLLLDWVTTSLAANPTRWELSTLRARAQDLNRNDPVAAGATRTKVVNVLGPGLEPQSRLRAEELGISEEKAEGLRHRVEQIFDVWARQADAANRLDFQEIQFLAFYKIIEDGEILVNPTWVEEPGRQLSRALELVAAERLETPLGKKNVFQGVELGERRRQPVRYWVRKADRIVTDMELPRREWVGLPARDSRGRPMILHIFPSTQPGQLRGVPMFAPVLTYFKNMADYLDAEVVAAKVAACLSVFITRNNPHVPVFPTTTEPGTGRKLDRLEPGMIPYLEIGEDIKLVDFKRGGETFNQFLQGVLRIIGNQLDLPYEILLKDFSQTNYSSARAALLEAWRHFQFWRAWFARKFCQPIWELVLEEAWLRGLIPVEDFYEQQAEYCRAVWIGPGRGWVDPVKEVVAAKLEEDYGYATLADQCAAQGRDWEEVLRQQAREMKKRQELGLPLVTNKQVQIIMEKDDA